MFSLIINSYYEILLLVLLNVCQHLLLLENCVTSDSIFDVYVIEKNIDHIVLLLGTIL